MAKVIPQTVRDTDVAELLHHPDNPRKGDLAAIGQSIDANGFYGTIVAQVGTGHVLAGNHRLIAAKEKGLSTLPVAWVECDDTTAKRILAADNGTGDAAGYDDRLLAALLSDLSNADALEGSGFDHAALDKLIAGLAAGDDLAPITGGEGTGSSGLSMLKWPGFEVNLTEEEAAGLTERYKEHAEEQGTGYGFVRALLDLDGLG